MVTQRRMAHIPPSRGPHESGVWNRDGGRRLGYALDRRCPESVRPGPQGNDGGQHHVGRDWNRGRRECGPRNCHHNGTDRWLEDGLARWRRLHDHGQGQSALQDQGRWNRRSQAVHRRSDGLLQRRRPGLVSRRAQDCVLDRPERQRRHLRDGIRGRESPQPDRRLR